jgi:hypothetical protein
MSTAFRFPLLAFALVLTSAATARADEPPPQEQQNLLRGPHPFRRQNELSAHMLLAGGGNGTPSGTKLALDYGYKLRAPFWLNLEFNYQHSACHTQSGAPPSGAAASTCPATGNVFETLAGAKAKFATPLPIVPFAKAALGFAYVFPEGFSSGWGFAGRGGVGANYFFFDWLGVGAELGVSLGRITTSHPNYLVIDVGGGLEFQF